MTAGRFEALGIGFEPDDGYTVVPFEPGAEVYDEHVGERLSAAGVDLSPRHIGSWLAARLAFLTAHDPRVFTRAVEVEPDGLLIVDLLALEPGGRVLAKLQLQAGPEGVCLLGVGTGRDAGTSCSRALVAALAAEPGRLAPVEVLVESTRLRVLRRYGYRDGRLLDV